MAGLGIALDETIRNLEAIRDKGDHPSPEVVEKIDKLYNLRIDLVEAAVNRATPQYANVTHALQVAAVKTKAALDGLDTLEKGLSAVAKAIKLIIVLLGACS